MAELKKCLNGEDFNSSDPELLAIIAKERSLLNDYNQTGATEEIQQRAILEKLPGYRKFFSHICPHYHDR